MGDAGLSLQENSSSHRVTAPEKIPPALPPAPDNRGDTHDMAYPKEEASSGRGGEGDGAGSVPVHSSCRQRIFGFEDFVTTANLAASLEELCSQRTWRAWPPYYHYYYCCSCILLCALCQSHLDADEEPSRRRAPTVSTADVRDAARVGTRPPEPFWFDQPPDSTWGLRTNAWDLDFGGDFTVEASFEMKSLKSSAACFSLLFNLNQDISLFDGADRMERANEMCDVQIELRMCVRPKESPSQQQSAKGAGALVLGELTVRAARGRSGHRQSLKKWEANALAEDASGASLTLELICSTNLLVIRLLHGCRTPQGAPMYEGVTPLETPRIFDARDDASTIPLAFSSVGSSVRWQSLRASNI